ncbi:hypothetical protein BBOV_III005540 [Babesia bovis T2Bo]|uniref:Ubiquitin-like domain-containing protein n=1 Tax=Babesia bovis TaxID=5865 RepID=A7ANI3_BABBO|nr:hypothetical protein BBOV_III005540 [Babesia bovis T2Bo]EDO08117.1 hypothetical protein BBOV_III005540 [Babesia bovis T2Bo]BAN66179.1 hypothetical protein [Babesia bovis]|eukprot:XP_001611685.1 hypothetical protein [Babesia bovis T2Bo]
MVNITINNHFGDKEPATLSLTNISDDITISSICILIENQFKCMKNDYNDERDPEEKFVLYLGHQELENVKQLSDYNSVGLRELAFYLYERQYLNVTVHLIKYISCCGLYFSPTFGKLFAKKLTLKVLDHENVLKLRNILLGYLDGYTNNKGEPLTVDTIRLVNNRYLMEDDLQPLKEVNDGKDLTLTLWMPVGYAVRPPVSLPTMGPDSATGIGHVATPDDTMAPEQGPVEAVPVVAEVEASPAPEETESSETPVNVPEGEAEKDVDSATA